VGVTWYECFVYLPGQLSMQYVDTDLSRCDKGIAFLASGRNWKCC